MNKLYIFSSIYSIIFAITISVSFSQNNIIFVDSNTIYKYNISTNTLNTIFKCSGQITNLKESKNKNSLLFLLDRKLINLNLYDLNFYEISFPYPICAFDENDTGDIILCYQNNNIQNIVIYNKITGSQRKIKSFDTDISVDNISVSKNYITAVLLDNSPSQYLFIYGLNDKCDTIIENITFSGFLSDDVIYFYEGMDDIADIIYIVSNCLKDTVYTLTNDKCFTYISKIKENSLGLFIIGNDNLHFGNSNGYKETCNSNKYLYIINNMNITKVSEGNYFQILDVIGNTIFLLERVGFSQYNIVKHKIFIEDNKYTKVYNNSEDQLIIKNIIDFPENNNDIIFMK